MPLAPGSSGDIVVTATAAQGLAKPPLLVLDRVRAFLDEHGLGSGDVRAQRIGEGGGSNFTFLLERDEGRFVLRRPPRPPLPPTAHDMVREARLQLALREAGFGRLPEIVAVAEDESILGVPFYVMSYLEGHVVTDELAPGLEDESARRRLARRSRRRARRDPRSGRGDPGSRGLRPPWELQRASGPALHAALGHQQDARAPASRAGGGVARREPSRATAGDRGARRLSPRQHDGRARRDVADRRRPRLGDGRDRRPARRRRLPARDLQRARRSAEPARHVARDGASRLPVEGRAGGAVRRTERPRRRVARMVRGPCALEGGRLLRGDLRALPAR